MRDYKRSILLNLKIALKQMESANQEQLEKILEGILMFVNDAPITKEQWKTYTIECDDIGISALPSCDDLADEYKSLVIQSRHQLNKK